MTTLALVVDALLDAEADAVVFLSLRERLGDLVTSDATEADLSILHGSLVEICDLAVRFDQVSADAIGFAILRLVASPQNLVN